MPLPVALAPLVAEAGANTGLIAAGAKILGNIFGGGGGPNIARSLSKQVGFTVLQSDANLVRARLAAGLDPRTGAATSRKGISPNPVKQIPRVSQTTDVPPGTGGFDAKAELQKAVGAAVSSLGSSLEDQIRAFEKKYPGTIAAAAPAVDPFLSKIIRTQAGPPRVPPASFAALSGAPKMSAMTLSMSGLPAIGRAVMSRGILRTATGRISGVVLGSGQRFSRKNAAALIRKVGLEAAAVALGIGVVEVAEILLAESTKRRRSGGITAAQVRNARSTTCKVARLARDLGVKPAPVRRKTSCR